MSEKTAGISWFILWIVLAIFFVTACYYTLSGKFSYDKCDECNQKELLKAFETPYGDTFMFCDDCYEEAKRFY